MSRLETNVFPITNLADLKTSYRLYRIRGLASDQDEYDHNVQILTGKLSRSLRSPVTVIHRGAEPFLVVPEEAPHPPSPFHLVRATAYFDLMDETMILDYENPASDTVQICLRFLQFGINGALFSEPRFWQPSAGHAFFERQPIPGTDGVHIYCGYSVRAVRVGEGSFGFCVDATHKYVSRDSLPSDLRREDFRKYKGARCVYRFGLGWYEIQLQDHTGLSIKEQMIENGAVPLISLYDYIMHNARAPLPSEVVSLSPDGPAVRYLTVRGDVRHAAATLCYPVYDTSDPRIQSMHRQTILKPENRRRVIHDFVKSLLNKVHTHKMVIQVSPEPLVVPRDMFTLPDLAFGNGVIFSAGGTTGATAVSLNHLGRDRLSALYNPNIGPYAQRPLDRQYIVIPLSVAESFGPAFLGDLKRAVDEIYPQEVPYDPTVITYNDRVPKTFAAQGKAILEAVNTEWLEPGYGIVMIHETERKKRQRDQLAAMLMHRLRQRGLYMCIIHTTVASECYRVCQSGQNDCLYEPMKTKLGKLNGYLRNVAINKVLLSNERWLFVLASPLNSDLTIAIDVQYNTACFTFMGKSGPDIRTELTVSKQKEKLGKSHVKRVILDVLRQEALLGIKTIQSIVVQRDGRLYSSEMNGVKEAIEILKKEGLMSGMASVNFVEIHKKSVISFRLFDVDTDPKGQEFIQNPKVGSYRILNNQDGYVCSTGREFNHPGTSKPLHVRHIEGPMPFGLILDDIYALSCLALTRPEDCSRLPFTLKLTDIRLTEHAGGYDEDALAFDADEPEDAEPSPESEEVEST